MPHHRHHKDKKHDKKHDKKPAIKVELAGHLQTQVSGQINLGQIAPTVGSTFGNSPSGQSYLSLLRPMLGLNYEPAPSDYNHLPPPQIYYDTDFSNQDFSDLWSPIGNKKEVGRDYVQILKQSLKANVIKMYNWNTARNHTPFLDYCEKNNLKVIVPISNFFVN